MVGNILDLQIVAFAVVCCVYSSSAQTTINSDDIPDELNNCKKEDDMVSQVFIGWPCQISCTDLHFWLSSSMGYSELDSYEGNITSCIVRERPSGLVVHNVSAVYEPMFASDFHDDAYVFDVTEDSPTEYIAEYQLHDLCSYQIFKINKSVLEEQSCNEVIYRNEGFEAAYADVVTPKCLLPSDMKEEIFNFKWLFDCNETLPSNAVPNTLGNVLLITNTSFANAGKYVCIVQYNGQEMNTVEHNVCVVYGSTAAEGITLTCETKPAIIGENATIQCSADLGIGKASTFMSYSTWTRSENVSDVICGTYVGSDTSKNGEAECAMKSSIEKKICYGKEPPDAIPHDIYTITLTLRNVKYEDLGQFILEYKFSEKKHFSNITLVEDRTRITAHNAGLIAAVACFALVLLILLCVVVWKRDYVKWWWRKHFGSYDEDVYTYTSYLAYYYNRETSNKSNIESLVTNLQGFIEKLGGKTYDEAKAISLSQYDAQNILQIHKDCHKIIILLSPEFVTDQWSLKTTYMALTEVVETGNKIIFIKMPGSKEQISKLETEPKNTLLYAMKRNTTIPWNGKTPFNNSFRHQLEYALPKLRPISYERTYSRYLSGTSQAALDPGRRVEISLQSSNENHENGFYSL